MIHTKPRYAVTEAASLLGVSRPHLYKRVKDGKIRLSKDGSRSFVDAAEIDRYVASMAGSTP